MKKMPLFITSILLAALLAGCGGNTADSAESTPTSDTVSEPLADPDTASKPLTVSDNQSEAKFDSLKLEISEGTLYIRYGSSFSLTRQDGTDEDYEIDSDVLYYKSSHSGKTILTLPETDSYETLQLIVGSGHVYVDDSITFQTLELEVEQGEVSMDAVTVTEDCSINVKQGSAFLSGDPGRNIKAICQEGHISLILPFDESSYNCEIESSDSGNIHFGKENYRGESASKKINNNADRSITLSCSRGDISVECK